MNKAIQLSYNDEFEYRCGCAASAGFRHVAVAYTEVVGKSDAEWEAITADILRILGKNALTCVQTHPHYYYPLLTSDELCEDMERDMRMAIASSGAIGAHYCVFHPVVAAGYDADKTLEDNKRWYAGLLDCAVRHGTGIAAENLPLFNAPGTPRPPRPSNCELLAPLADYFNDPRMGICWDFGHANQTVRDAHAEWIATLGSRIKCTHVHNNYGSLDCHIPPIYGNTEWRKVLPALLAAGYDGPLTLEVDFPYASDRELMASTIRHCYDCLAFLERMAK